MLNIKEKLLKNIENKNGKVLISISKQSDFDEIKQQLDDINILLVKSKGSNGTTYELYHKECERFFYGKVNEFRNITLYIVRGDIYNSYFRILGESYLLWYAINKGSYNKDFIELALTRLNTEGSKVVYDEVKEFKNKRVVLDINEEIEGYNLVFKDDDLEKIKYENIDEVIKYFTEEEIKQRIFDDEFKELSEDYKIENFYLFIMPKLVTLKDKLNNII